MQVADVAQVQIARISVMIKEQRLWSQVTRVLILSWFFSSCVTLNNVPHLSEPVSSYQMVLVISTSRDCWED